MAWISSWTFIPFLFTAPTLLFVLFPDGHLLGRGWLIVFWLVVATICSTTVDAMFSLAMDDAPFLRG